MYPHTFKVGDRVTVEDDFFENMIDSYDLNESYKKTYVTSIDESYIRVQFGPELWRSNGNQGWAINPKYLKLRNKKIIVITEE